MGFNATQGFLVNCGASPNSVPFFANASGIWLSGGNTVITISPAAMSMYGALTIKDNITNSNTVTSISSGGALSCSSITCGGKVSGYASFCSGKVNADGTKAF